MRRETSVYESVHGELPRKGNARQYSEEVLERLGAARLMRDKAGFQSLEAALLAIQSGALKLEAVQPLAQVSETDKALLELLQQVQTLTRAVERLEAKIDVQHEQMKALEGERSGERAPKWWQFWRR